MAKQTHSDAEYVSLKQQYDTLLEKNQSDLIKIKQKEKALNDTIDKVRKEGQERENGLKDKIEALEKELQRQREGSKKQGTLVVDVKSKEDEKIADLEADIRRLMDENISLTADHTSLTVNLDAEQRKTEQLALEVSNLRKFISSLQADLKEKTLQQRPAVITASIHTMTDFPYVSQEETKSMKEAIEYLRKQLQKEQSHCSQMTAKLKEAGEQSRRTLDKQRKMVNLLRKRENELTTALTELDKLKLSAKPKRKKTQSEEGECQKCNELKQEVHLLKDMVRSSQVMVRVKQIEVEKYRIHNSEDISNKETNKSMNKHESKFPPLKKK